MKYAYAVIALAGAVAALPAEDKEWESWSTTTSSSTTKKVEDWETWTTTSSTTKSYDPWATWTTTSSTTKKADEWESWKTTTTTKKEEWETYKPSTTKSAECSYTTTYVKTVYKDNKPCEETETSTIYPETCTWGEYTVPVVSETTWAEVPKVTTPAVVTTEWNTWKASSTVSGPVAKWTGAANKQVAGMGALAVAGVAFLL